MLGYIEIVPIYLKKTYFLYPGKERPAKTKLIPEKLRTVLANFEFTQIFRNIYMWGLVSQRNSFNKKFDSVQC